MKTNLEIAQVFEEFAEILQLKGELSFKIIAYRKAEEAIREYPYSLEDLFRIGGIEALQTIPGVGEGISRKIEELINSGKVKELDELRKAFPRSELDFLKIPGVGPSTAKMLFTTFGNISIPELSKELSKKSLDKLSPKMTTRIIQGIEVYKNLGDRMLIFEATQIADRIIKFLSQKCKAQKVVAVGSLRRFKETVGDIDIVATSENPEETINLFEDFSDFKEILGKGKTKLSGILSNGREVDLEILPAKKYGTLLLHFTGSKEHNVALRALAQKKGLSLSEHGIKNRLGKLFTMADERGVYTKLGLDYIEPELREDRGEIEAAKDRKLPKLVQREDIVGDLHVHSTWSDGLSSIEANAKRAKSLGYKYIGICDHLERFRDDKKILARSREIEKVSIKEKIKILNACEASIKKDGSLDYSDEVLEKFDFVIASIHSVFDLNEQDMTKRLIKAIENPFVKIIGHPSARIINHRPSIKVNWEEIFKACVKNNVLLEINAQPSRLDLMDYLVQDAKKFGVKFVVNTDSHSVEEFDFIKYGLMVARRGWLQKSDIMNTSDQQTIKRLVQQN